MWDFLRLVWNATAADTCFILFDGLSCLHRIWFPRILWTGKGLERSVGNGNSSPTMLPERWFFIIHSVKIINGLPNQCYQIPSPPSSHSSLCTRYHHGRLFHASFETLLKSSGSRTLAFDDEEYSIFRRDLISINGGIPGHESAGMCSHQAHTLVRAWH